MIIITSTINLILIILSWIWFLQMDISLIINIINLIVAVMVVIL